tara:strand:- start:5952 stop:6311 length:360 start_codon:yes stop_codon:yes gene_type:complete
MTGQGLSILIISLAVFVAAVVFAVKSEKFRAAAVGVAGAAAALVTTLVLFFVASKEHKRNVKIRQTAQSLRKGRGEAAEDAEETEAAAAEEVKKEEAVHEGAEEEQEALTKPKRTRLKA